MTVFAEPPPSPVWPLPIPDGTGMVTLPHPLADLLLASRQQAARVIHPTSVQDPLIRAVLLAEIHLRLGQRTRAATAAEAALSAAESEKGARRLLATAVAADVACALADPSAVRRSLTLMELSLEQEQTRRTALASALYATVVYQQRDCQEGQDLFADLLARSVLFDSVTSSALHEGLTVMGRRCAHPPKMPPLLTDPLEPAPGGLLYPALDDHAVRWVRERLLAHTGRHTCSTTPAQ